MPAAVVENGTRKNQRKVISTLSNLERDVTLAKIQSPAVVAVGKVCALSSQFDWFSSMPLFGATVAVTGPSDESSKLLDKLSLYGANVLSCPALRIRPICPNPSLDLAIDNLYNYQVATFSGKNAVTYFFDALYAKKWTPVPFPTCTLPPLGKKLRYI